MKLFIDIICAPSPDTVPHTAWDSFAHSYIPESTHSFFHSFTDSVIPCLATSPLPETVRLYGWSDKRVEVIPQTSNNCVSLQVPIGPFS